MLGGPSGEVAGGHPDGQATGDLVDAGLDGGIVFVAGGIASDDLVAAFVQDRDRDEPDRVVLVGLDDDEGVVRAVEASISMNSASSDGSSM
ncbi:hypothetical protein JE024_39170 (plasmid) [Streptomyces zhihengii]|uniref:Uncharacterized protein n=1 Tax=Streptomyces zhihengii TaxID=1818004 RepID=A0ABS2V508_9ACTN|nr:hypothetical protein [Streptomyces zhihengii]